MQTSFLCKCVICQFTILFSTDVVVYIVNALCVCACVCVCVCVCVRAVCLCVCVSLPEARFGEGKESFGCRPQSVT